MNIERREVPGCELRVSNPGGGSGTLIQGYAAVFGQKTELYGFTEEIAPGAFRESIRTDDIRALFNHDPNFVLGRNRSGTLELREDSRGLLIRNRPPDVQWARDLLTSISRGDISGMSFGFVVPAEGDSWTVDAGVPHRTIKRARLFDVSPVTYPAYPQTSVGLAGDVARQMKVPTRLLLADADYRRRRLMLLEAKF